VVVVRTPEQVASARWLHEESGCHVTPFIGSPADDGKQPQGYLVENPPDFLIRPHFHGANQFQVMVGGSGSIGRQGLGVGYLHYVDGFTPYGPIQVGHEGLDFLTLRQNSYAGIHYMPGSKDEMKVKAGRNRVAELNLSAPRTTHQRRIVEEPDGLAIVELGAAQGDLLPEPEPAVGHGGAYLVVMAGELVRGRERCSARSLFWIGPNDAWPKLQGGLDGALVAFLGFPLVNRFVAA
jgi:hypothetical protein